MELQDLMNAMLLEIWVEARSGSIFEGGNNNIPKPWNPET